MTCPLHRFLPLLGALVLAGCQAASPTRPESPLVGTWAFSYDASVLTDCVWDVYHVGCGGGGELEIETALDGTLSVSGTGGWGCQTCRMATDGGGPFDATRLAAPLRLRFYLCDATIPEPPPGATRVDGTMVCTSDRIPGTITLQRR